MTLAEFIKKQEEDDNFVWTLDSGELINLLEEALEEIDRLKKWNAKLEEDLSICRDEVFRWRARRWSD